MKHIFAAALALALAGQVQATTTYAKGTTSDTAAFESRFIQVATCSTGTESAPTSAAWVAGTVYAAGALISYNNVPYVSLAASNSGHYPSVSADWWLPLGLDLMRIASLTVHAETAGTMTAGGKFLAYLWNAETSTWNPVSDGTLDLTASAVAKQAWSGFHVDHGPSRLVYIPSGIGLAVTIYLSGSAN
jgi:hypothetical protein